MLANLGRNAVSAVNNTFAVRDFVFAIDEDCALTAEFVDHKTVVNDLFADIDRRTESFERDADDINGADDAGAESARLQQ